MITNIRNIDLRIGTIRKNQCKKFKRINENTKNITTKYQRNENDERERTDELEYLDIDDNTEKFQYIVMTDVLK